MGYRSEVGMILSAEAYELLVCELDKERVDRILNNNNPDKFNSTIDLLDVMEDNGASDLPENSTDIIFYYSWIKWYDSYDEVQFVERMLDMMEERDLAYSFLRIGEENQDIDARYNRSEDLCIDMYASRTISFS